MLFVPPNQYLLCHVGTPHQRTQRTLQMRIPHALARDFRCSWDADIPRQTLGIRNQRVTGFCLRIAEEMASPSIGHLVMIEGFAIAAMLELSRHFNRAEETAPKRGGCRLGSNGGSMKVSWKALRRRTCPSYCRISPRHLTRAFKEQNGCTIGEYTAVMRARKAQRLRREEDLTIGDVARRLSYSSHAEFSTAFRKTTGLRPSEYRRLKISRYSWR